MMDGVLMQMADANLVTVFGLVVITWIVALAGSFLSSTISLRNKQKWDDLPSKQRATAVDAIGIGCYPAIIVSVLLLGLIPEFAASILTFGVPLITLWAFGGMLASALGGALPIVLQRRATAKDRVEGD